MAEPLKTFFSPKLVARLGATLVAVEPSFPEASFIEQACLGLEQLELVARAKHIASALSRCLPRAYPEALQVLLRSLGPKHEGDELVGVGMAPFFYCPHLFYITEHGLDHFELSLDAQYEITQRFTAEASIRNFIQKDPERCFAKFKQWSQDPSPHVRRLVSEGTRLRLPWAPRVAWLDNNPQRVLELLETLKDDPATLVRRSVANNLNDLGKSHPKLLLETSRRWLQAPSTERRALIEHALRSAVKRGDAGALELLGFGSKPRVSVSSVRFQPERVRIGENVTLELALTSEARRTQDLLVNLAVQFVKARGRVSAKVFKLKRLKLRAGESVSLTTRISLAVHTTRKPYPGVHAVDLLLNGTALPIGSFEVVAADLDASPAATSKTTRASTRNVKARKSATAGAATLKDHS